MNIIKRLKFIWNIEENIMKIINYTCDPSYELKLIEENKERIKEIEWDIKKIIKRLEILLEKLICAKCGGKYVEIVEGKMYPTGTMQYVWKCLICDEEFGSLIGEKKENKKVEKHKK